MNNIIEKDHPNFIFKYYLIMRTYYAFLLRSLRKYKENLKIGQFHKIPLRNKITL